MGNWIVTIKSATTGNPAVQNANVTGQISQNGAGVSIIKTTTDTNGQCKFAIPWNGGVLDYQVLAVGFWNPGNKQISAGGFSGDINVPTVLLKPVQTSILGTPVLSGAAVNRAASPGSGSSAVSYVGGAKASVNETITNAENTASNIMGWILVLAVLVGGTVVLSKGLGGSFNPLALAGKLKKTTGSILSTVTKDVKGMIKY